MHDIDTINAIDSIDTLTACSPRVSPVKDFTDWHFQDESYFAGQQYYHPEKGISRHGVAGDPLPYLTSRDDSIGILLVTVFITGIIAFSFSRDMLLRQMKNFFYVPRRVAEMTVTVMETRSQYVLLLCTIANIATVCFLHYNHTTHESTLSFYPPLLIGLYALIIACSFLLRLILYSVVNWVFFDKKKNVQWSRSWLFLSICEGALIFPVIVLNVYADITVQALVLFSLFIVILAKVLTFYKSKTIFFNGIGGFLQNILYFCALEMMPLLILCGILIDRSNDLDIYF